MGLFKREKSKPGELIGPVPQLPAVSAPPGELLPPAPPAQQHSGYAPPAYAPPQAPAPVPAPQPVPAPVYQSPPPQPIVQHIHVQPVVNVATHTQSHSVSQAQAVAVAKARSGSSLAGCLSCLVWTAAACVVSCAGIGILANWNGQPSPSPHAAPVRAPAVMPVASAVEVAAEPDAASPAQSFPSFAPPPDESRIWTSGQFATDATFAGMVNQTVRLKKPDGSIVNIPLDKLSEADQQWISERVKRGK